MTPEQVALVGGVALALAALAFVLYPLVVGAPVPSTDAARRPPRGGRAAGAESVGDTGPRRGAAIEALREIEFDRATGKLSDADYEALKATYTREALAALRADDSARAEAAIAADDPAEAAVRRYRGTVLGAPACEAHGPRPEPDAVYCSECGRYLAGTCAHCGTPVSRQGARFCEGCGRALAAA